MELSLICLPDDAIHGSGFGREDTGALELDTISQLVFPGGCWWHSLILVSTASVLSVYLITQVILCIPGVFKPGSPLIDQRKLFYLKVTFRESSSSCRLSLSIACLYCLLDGWWWELEFKWRLASVDELLPNFLASHPRRWTLQWLEVQSLVWVCVYTCNRGCTIIHIENFKVCTEGRHSYSSLGRRHMPDLEYYGELLFYKKVNWKGNLAALWIQQMFCSAVTVWLANMMMSHLHCEQIVTGMVIIEGSTCSHFLVLNSEFPYSCSEVYDSTASIHCEILHEEENLQKWICRIIHRYPFVLPSGVHLFSWPYFHEATTFHSCTIWLRLQYGEYPQGSATWASDGTHCAMRLLPGSIFIANHSHMCLCYMWKCKIQW